MYPQYATTYTKVESAIGLRARYAIYGTDILYGSCTSSISLGTGALTPLSPFAMPGTEIAYPAPWSTWMRTLCP
eukprot:3177312-Rhodomonas_salina.4